jgi:hypothetical protein
MPGRRCDHVVERVGSRGEVARGLPRLTLTCSIFKGSDFGDAHRHLSVLFQLLQLLQL